jgi:hypothetical protein
MSAGSVLTEYRPAIPILVVKVPPIFGRMMFSKRKKTMPRMIPMRIKALNLDRKAQVKRDQ